MQHKRRGEITSLKRIFAALDVDGSGAIDEAEFLQACTNREDIMNKFRLLDFDEREIMNLFKDLEVSSDGLLSLEEFESGLHSMQGEAKCKDMVRIQKGIERLNQHVEALSDRLPAKEGGGSDVDWGTPTAFGKRKSVGRNRPLRKPSLSSSLSTTLPSTPDSEAFLKRSLPGLPISAPLLGPASDFQSQDLAELVVNQIKCLEQRMEQRFEKLELRQASALEAIVAHLNINSSPISVDVTGAGAYYNM